MANKANQKISQLSEMLAQYKQGDLLLLDIDKTLIDKNGDLIDPNAPKLIAELQERGAFIFALTARSPQKNKKTFETLNRLEINFTPTGSIQKILEELKFSVDRYCYSQGIFYAKSEKSGEAEKHCLLKELTHQLAELNKNDRITFSRILMADDNNSQIESILEAGNNGEFYLSKIPNYANEKWQQLPRVKIFQFEPKSLVKIYAKSELYFPDTLNGLTYEAALEGGTESVHLLKDHKGIKYVLKTGLNPDAMKTEIVMNGLYQALGVTVPDFAIYDHLPYELSKIVNRQSKGIFQLAEFIEDVTDDNSAIKEERIRKDFIAHCILGNIDIQNSANILQDKSNELVTIDSGANYIYRALGKIRMENPSLVTEVETLRNKQISPITYAWFKDLTQKDIRQQVIHILSLSKSVEERIWEISNIVGCSISSRDELIQLFANRLDYLVTRFCPELKLNAMPDRPAIKGHTAAGVFVYARTENGAIKVLLARRSRHTFYDCFGGGSENEDKDLHHTAAREVREESDGLINFSSVQLRQQPYHDLISEKNGKPFVYRMYFMEHHFIEANEFHGKDGEHDDFVWVLLTDIHSALVGSEIVYVEEENTIQLHIEIAEGKTKQVPIYPPFYQMLQQHVFQKAVYHLLNSQTIKFQTQGIAGENGFAENSQIYPNFLSPHLIWNQQTDTLVNKAELLLDFKKNKAYQLQKRNFAHEHTSENELLESNKNSNVFPNNKTNFTQLHLKAVLQETYEVNDMAANVKQFIDNELKQYNYTAEELRLIEEVSLEAINREMQHPDDMAFYHAVNDQVGFSYCIYSEILKKLNVNADNDYLRFRFLTSWIDKFPNIESVINYYSEAGKETINNNSAGFSEICLSCNLAFFGNHQDISSFSVNYFLKNGTRRDITLQRFPKIRI